MGAAFRTARIDTARAKALRVLAVTLTLLVGVARADKIDDLIGDLTASSDRVRISAVLALANQKAARAIPALSKRLLDTSEQKNIRGLAATAIGRTLQDGNPSSALKKQGIDALTRAKDDPEPFVSSKAEAALGQLGSSATPAVPMAQMKGVYVNVGPMSSKTGSSSDAKFRASMASTAKSTLTRVAPSYAQSWNGGVPTKVQLQKKKIAGFYVDGTLNVLSVSKTGSSATISCKVSMLLADFPDRAVFGFLNGGANVQGGASQRDIDLAQTDCIQAVIEDLIAKKIVPTIRSKVP